ncbi:MAG: hypothetical protein ABIK20_04925, partial [Candidatus Omnitrophota bacterium]
VDFVELLVYTWDADTEALLKKEVPLLKNLNLVYTVHLPTDRLTYCKKAYSFLASSGLKILNFTLHPLRGWEGFIADKEDVSLENLVERYPLYERMTLDIGHSILAGLDLKYFSGAEIKEIHISGVNGGKAHHEVTEKELTCLKDFRSDNLLVNIEVFELKTLVNSLRRLKKWRNQFRNN